VEFAPTASLALIERRAAALATVRAFFAQRGVLEIDAPALINAPVSDVNLHSAEVRLGGATGETPGDVRHVETPLYLHTSPEYVMKRLLAAGASDIYFLGHVFRGAERGRAHNPEFTLIEWYRCGVSIDALMDEVAALVQALSGGEAASRPIEQLTYREAFLREAGFDPLEVPRSDLERAAQRLGLDAARIAVSTRDDLLDLVMGAEIGPRLGRGRLTFVRAYPASQAALAQLDPADPRVALRFELYAEGLELANGFQELADASEQRARFEADLRERDRRGLPTGPLDERLLAALAAGLPDCAGVAVGFDRVLMLATGAASIDAVLPFPTERA